MTSNPFSSGGGQSGSRRSDTQKIAYGQILSVLHRRKLPVISKNIARVRSSLLRSKRNRKPNAKDISIRESAGDWQIVYGRMQVGGVITYAQVVDSDRKLLTVHTIACHEIDAVEKIFVDNTELTFGPSWGWCTGPATFANKVYAQVNPGTASQSAFSQLVTDSGGKWTSNHRQRGRAGVYLKFIWDEKVFLGVPEVYFQIRGKKCFDPRTSTTPWTDNAALIVADYLMDSTFGLGVPSSKIDMDRLSAAANECEESVALLGGGVEGRYYINGVFDSKESPRSVLENMAAAIGGSITYVSGKWKVWPAVWRAPVVTLTDDDMRSLPRIQTRQSRRDSFNAIKGTFISPKDNYEETDFPIVKNALYLAQDGGEEVVEDISLPLTTSVSACQRIAKQELERVRQGIVVEHTAGLKAYGAEPVENIYLAYSRYGWDETPKAFEVLDTQIVSEDSDGAPVFAVRLRLKETAEGVFAWNSGMETAIDVAPNTDLPNPFSVTDPTDLDLDSGTDQLFIRRDGTVFSGIKASWTAPADGFVNSGGQIEVQFKKTADTAWQPATPVPGDQTSTLILDVQDGVSYDVRVRSLSSFGTRGNWVTANGHVVIGKTAPPSDVSGFAAQFTDFGIVFSWAAIPDLDLSHYELRAGSSWDTATFIAEVRGTSFRLDTRAAGSYDYLIKARDTSRNYSTNATKISANIPVPAAPVPSFVIDGADLLLSWTQPASTFKIESYEIRYGDDYATATLLATTKSTMLRTRVDWSGTRRFWVAARDVAGNLGAEAQAPVLIEGPGTVDDLLARVVDNNVQLFWDPPVLGTLPISHYRVYRGSQYPTPAADGLEAKGDVSGTFASILEVVGGTYTYWLVAVDTAGNQSAGESVTVLVDQPPDFVLKTDRGVDPRDATTSSNIYVEGHGYLTVSQSTPAGQSVGLLLAITSA